MKSAVILAFACATLSLQGCSSLSSLDSHNMASAPSHTFNAPKAKVVDATQKSVEAMYTLESVKPAEPTTQIYFSKPVSPFSWGEVGRIDVTGLTDASTKVSLGSEKRASFQLTGTTQDEFAEKLFGKIQENLK